MPRKIVPAKKGKNSKKQLGFVKSQLKSLSQSDILDTINEIEDIEIFEELKTKDPSNKANSKLVSMLEKYCKEILDRIDSPSSFEDQEDEDDINQQISSYKNSLNMSFLKLTFNCLGLADFTFQLKAEHLEHKKLAKFLKEEIYDNEEFLNFNLKIPFLQPLKPENRQFINNFKIFWKIIFNQTDLINDEIHLLQHIQEWMVIFSESRLRPVRHGSIEMAKIFLDLGKEFLKENLIKQEKEKDAEQRKEIVLNMKLIESLCNELFDIMTNRLKDVCEKIREKAARSFFDTILAFPEKFVTNEIFEDSQFLLKDKDDEINIIALDFAQKITKLLYQRAQNQIKQQGNLNENEVENSVLEEQSEDLKTIIDFYSQQSTRRLVLLSLFRQTNYKLNLQALKLFHLFSIYNPTYFTYNTEKQANNQDLSCHILTSFLNLINKIKPNILNQNNHQQQIDNLTEVLFHHTSAIYDYNSVFALLEQEDNDKNSSFNVKKFQNFDLLLLMIAESSAKYAQQIMEGQKNLPKIELEKYSKIIPSFSLSLIKNTQPLLQKYLQKEQNLNLNESEYGNKDDVKKQKQENQLKITGLLSLYQYVEESQINDSDFSEILKIILKLLDDLFIATENPQTIESIGKIINTYQKKINKSNHKILLQDFISKIQNYVTEKVVNYIQDIQGAEQNPNQYNLLADIYSPLYFYMMKLQQIYQNTLFISDKVQQNLLSVQMKFLDHLDNYTCDINEIHLKLHNFAVINSFKQIILSSNHEKITIYKNYLQNYFNVLKQILEKQQTTMKFSLNYLQFLFNDSLNILSTIGSDQVYTAGLSVIINQDYNEYFGIIFSIYQTIRDLSKSHASISQLQQNDKNTSEKQMIDEMQKLQLDNVPKNVENNVLTQITKLCSHSTLFSYSILVQDIIRDFIIQHIQQQKIIEDQNQNLNDDQKLQIQQLQDNLYLINLLKQLKQKEVQPENEKQLIFWHLIEKLLTKFIEEDENQKAADELNKLVIKLYFTQRERVQKYQETAKSKFLTFLISMINIQLDLQQDDNTGAYNEQNFQIFKYLEILLDTCKPQKSGYIQPKNLKYLFVLLDQKINQNKEERAEKNLKEINEIQGFKYLQSFHQHLMKINGFKLQNSENEKQDTENKQNTDKMLEENDNEQKEEELDYSSKKRKSSKIKDLNLNLYSDTKDTDDEQEKNDRRQTRKNQSKNKMLEESISEKLDNKDDQQYQQYDADLLDSTNNQIKKQNKKTKTKKQDIQIESGNDMSDESSLFSDDENTIKKNHKKNQQKIRVNNEVQSKQNKNLTKNKGKGRNQSMDKKKKMK